GIERDRRGPLGAWDRTTVEADLAHLGMRVELQHRMRDERVDLLELRADLTDLRRVAVALGEGDGLGEPRARRDEASLPLPALREAEQRLRLRIGGLALLELRAR